MNYSFTFGKIRASNARAEYLVPPSGPLPRRAAIQQHFSCGAQRGSIRPPAPRSVPYGMKCLGHHHPLYCSTLRNPIGRRIEVVVESLFIFVRAQPMRAAIIVLPPRSRVRRAPGNQSGGPGKRKGRRAGRPHNSLSERMAQTICRFLTRLRWSSCWSSPAPRPSADRCPRSA